MFRLFECCALSFFERFVLSLFLKIERFVSDSAEIWICGLYKIRLAYNDEYFSVPENLYIIGMMNTADRSLAMIDYALRRRFSFFDMTPGFDSVGFKKYQENLDCEVFNKVIDAVKALNIEIAKDDSLGKGFCIGHSYFCNRESIDNMWLENVIEYDIAPMLREYWFDNDKKFKEETDKLLSLIK